MAAGKAFTFQLTSIVQATSICIQITLKLTYIKENTKPQKGALSIIINNR